MKEYPKSNLNRIKRGQIRANYDVETISKILEAGFVCYVGYQYEDYPISIPMAYGYDGTSIFLHGSQGNRMLNALVSANKLSVTVMHLDGLVLARSGLHHSVNYRSATLFGQVQIVDADAEKLTALKCIMDQMMEGRWEGIRPMHQQELDRTLVVKMTIDTASAKIRDVGVNDEPEDYDLDVWAGLVPLKQIAQYPVADTPLKEGVDIPEHVLNYYNTHKHQTP